MGNNSTAKTSVHPDSIQLMHALKRFVKNQFFKTPSYTADASYQQTVISNGKKLNSQKYPYFHYLTNQHMFAMAGIWNETKKREGCVRSFSVLTQPASLKFTPYPSSHASYNKSARLVGLVGQRFSTRHTALVLFAAQSKP